MIERMSHGAQTSTIGAAAPTVGWASGPLGAVQAADREISRQTAARARAIAEFAASRPASADRAQGERGAMSAERWAAGEAAAPGGSRRVVRGAHLLAADAVPGSLRCPGVAPGDRRTPVVLPSPPRTAVTAAAGTTSAPLTVG
jgi:hypothetical protein